MKKKRIRNFPTPENILEYLQKAQAPLRTTTIMERFQLSIAVKKNLETLLKKLAERKAIRRLPDSLWAIKDSGATFMGEFQAYPGGGGKVQLPGSVHAPFSEIKISRQHANGAWHKDIVRVQLQKNTGRGHILEIVSRPNELVQGIFYKAVRKHLFFKAVDGRNNGLFAVSKKDAAQWAIDADLVVTLRPQNLLDKNRELWEAEIVAITGPLASEATQEAIVKYNQQVPCEFPDLALTQAAQLPQTPLPEELAAREDLRGLAFVTIDGTDARDFDDAIHVEKTDTGYTLRVGIADVSHYVLPDERAGSLDAEAKSRGNSWYFPRSVEPMLPKALSNGLCSLRPGEDRLAMLVEITYNRQGQVRATRFAPIAMRSAARLIYGDVAQFFSGDATRIDNLALRQMLKAARELSELLFQLRRKCGTLDFILPDPVYEFDANGRLLAMKEAERNAAHMLIEEFMIAANEAVAKYLGGLGQALLYRVHPKPEPEKLAQLLRALKQTAPECLPPQAIKNEEILPADLQGILARAQGTAKEYLVNRLCLRSMGQARYQPENIGHFGLASNAYCHFTSPIRRYADLMAHRVLKSTLKGYLETEPDFEQLATIANHLNSQERKAIECEREMAKRLACLALLGAEGEILAGTISGITDFGLFVEFATMPAEGLIPLELLGKDWFEVDMDKQRVIGVHTRKSWSLGQAVKVRLIGVNLQRQEIRLVPSEPAQGTRHKPSSRKPGKKRMSESPNSRKRPGR